MIQVRCDHCGKLIDHPTWFKFRDTEFNANIIGTGDSMALCAEHEKELGEWLMAFRNQGKPDEAKEQFNWGLH